MVVFRKDPCGFTCLLMTYAAVLYADYVVIRWIGKKLCLKNICPIHPINTGCRLQLAVDRIFTPIMAVLQFHEIFVDFFCNNIRNKPNFLNLEFKKQPVLDRVLPQLIILTNPVLYSIIYDARFLLGIISYYGFQHYCHNVIHGTL